MKILVSGLYTYRDFRFPGAFFRPEIRHKFCWVDSNLYRGSYYSRDLTDTAFSLAKQIIQYGGVKEVTFDDKSVMTVWTFSSSVWLGGQLEAFIKEKINNQFGTPEKTQTVYLPFGLKLLIPK